MAVLIAGEDLEQGDAVCLNQGNGRMSIKSKHHSLTYARIAKPVL